MTRISHDALLFGNEFRGEELGLIDLILAYRDRRCALPGCEVDRGVPAKRVDIVFRDLTKPDSFFDVLVWGMDSRFSADYVTRARGM